LKLEAAMTWRWLGATLVLCGLVSVTACESDEDGGTDVASDVATDTAVDDTGTADTSSDAAETGAPAVVEVDCDTVTPDATVSIAGLAFDPVATSITAGQVVQWTNADTVPHTVTAGTPVTPDPDLFDSGNLSPDDDVCLRFDDAGVFPYYCTVHPMMMATVTVE
jgi:plastocyanin